VVSVKLAWRIAAGSVLLLTVFIAGCGGETEDFRRGGADAERALDGFLQGWIAASGPRADTITASQTRRFLGGELGAQVAGAQVGGGQTTRRIEQIYNDIMLLPFPPDDGYEIIESTGDADRAFFRVKFKYTGNAASQMAALQLIPFARVQEVHDQVVGGPERNMFLERHAELGWQVVAVEEP
jgi:hypothetical protein